MKYSEHEIVPMQHLLIHAKQDLSFEHEAIFGGAFIGCWIKNNTAQKAFLISKEWIESHGWNVLELESQKIVSAENYTKEESGREFYEQALQDEEIFVFDTYAKEDEAEPVDGADGTR